MIEMSLMELILQVLLSPYVIGATIAIVIYASIVSAVSRNRERIPKAPKLKRSAKVKKFRPDKPGLEKNEDISDLGLE
ncbi:MAG: hypothetical protein LBG27_12585 [Spirochaetaceae bacterium]|jgi:hypothetical protein|nr:hypothetical protein [Spirochaetaceae bacterium]